MLGYKVNKYIGVPLDNDFRFVLDFLFRCILSSVFIEMELFWKGMVDGPGRECSDYTLTKKNRFNSL